MTEKNDTYKNALELRIDNFPSSPGVYIMKDAKGNPLYIGKAKNLRQRIRAYFQPSSGDQRLSIPFLRHRIHDVDFIVTDSEKEALLLENTLIKKYKPRYNIKLRDDKTYLSLRIDLHTPYPRLEIIRRRRPGDDALYFGPFSSAAAIKETLRFVQRIFPLRMCKDTQFRNRSRPCLMYHVKKCLAPCVYPVSKEEYNALVQGVILFFQGKKEEVIKYLKTLMHSYAERLEFEKAALIRDKITAIRKSIEHQKVSSYREFTLDAIGIARDCDRLVVSVLHYRNGLLEESRDFEFVVYEQREDEIIRSFIGQFYGAEKFIPPEVIVPAEPEDKDTLAEWLSEMRGSKVKIFVPKRGEKLAILRLATENARRKLELEKQKSSDRDALLEKVRKSLALPRLPRRIECFDISNIMGKFSVGSMVSFYNAEPDKNNYRRFKIRTINSPDDYAMIKEVLERRYKRLVTEGRELPDLILIDGGKGQLNIAAQVVRELGLNNVPLAAIAKGRYPTPRLYRQKKSTPLEYDHIYLPNRKNPLNIRPGSAVLLLLQRIRDEAHRFAISYHKKLRSKKQLGSELDAIPGIGTQRRKALLKHLGSVEKIKKASVEELTGVPGITRSIAEKIYTYFHQGKQQQR
ncbi:excinuclease ABC subunit UvrC [Candidatus Sumerlaeota bacterium]|nr:excinuclease ABC subunit UvrC [Candidatus Sumerlaeota bacterium]